MGADSGAQRQKNRCIGFHLDIFGLAYGASIALCVQTGRGHLQKGSCRKITMDRSQRTRAKYLSAIEERVTPSA